MGVDLEGVCGGVGDRLVGWCWGLREVLGGGEREECGGCEGLVGACVGYVVLEEVWVKYVLCAVGLEDDGVCVG